MNKIQRFFVTCCLFCLCGLAATAQEKITSVHGVIEDEFGPLMGATICEIDANGRVISGTQTDINGNFTMKVINQKDKLRFQFLGMTTQTLPIDRTSYNITLQAEAHAIQEVTVTSQKRMEGNSLHIPDRHVATAKQTIKMDEFEGLAVTTVDEALQGRVAGLDIVSLSGNLGSGSVMRLRGASSLSSLTNENPLIVVDGNVWDVDMSNFDISSSNEEKFAELLNINPEDIASINVLKDASATAIYGSQGGNGVIEFTTRRGLRGAPKITYSYKLSETFQPQGIKLLNGDDYTMMLKEAYFNPYQEDQSGFVDEINYIPTFSEYEQYNNNTDWRKAVTQVGVRQNHYVTISGGGDRAQFRVSGGFDNETGSVICQKLQRFTTRANLDYNVSKRIRVQTNFSMTYTKNYRNSDDLLSIAQKKMPNMSIYEQDPVTGVNTDRYYNMLQSGIYIGNEIFKDDQRSMVNPVASAHLAKNTSTSYNLNPELILNYELLGMEDGMSRLTWKGQVYMNVFNEYSDRFYPAELVSTVWTDGHNTSFSGSNKSLSFTTKHTLTYQPYFDNEDHFAMAMVRFEMTSGSSNGQSTDGSGLPTGGITSPDAGGLIKKLNSNYAEWRSMYYTASLHYAYKDRYTIGFDVRADGTTKFGPDHRWGLFPAAKLRWNVIDENFMEMFRERFHLSMLSIRGSLGLSGHAPNRDYLYTSKYVTTGAYLDMSGMRPENLRLNDLQWEKVKSTNVGFDLGFLDDRITTAFEIYHSVTSDMLMTDSRIPSSSGFSTLSYRNNGKMSNTGWEFQVNTNRLIKHNKLTVDFNVNFGNNRNEILSMDESILKVMNSNFGNENVHMKNGRIAGTLTRVQLHNPFGSIYGFRSKGIYQYEYETVEAMGKDEQAAFFASGKTAPVALDSEGHVIYNEKGEPLRMMFDYTNDGTGRNYTFKGGDAIYEDVNHDGQINALDIVYLGSSLPKLTGGFGFSVNYGNWRLSSQFSYRVGNKIVNAARLLAEAMNTNNNQSQAVNYRWRKEGDVTSIPRAMYGMTSNYNTMISDRFVESGSYLRVNYLQLSYAMASKDFRFLKAMHINKVNTYLSANNPFVFTKYTGADPDISSRGYGPAIDSYQTPRAKYFTMGITVNF